jgi:hypothetical protein
MSDYAGACAAIRARFEANWTTTPYGFLNEAPPTTVNTSGEPVPWALFELVHAGSSVVGIGAVGNRVIAYDGIIKVYVFVPLGSGVEVGSTHAVAIGEIFKDRVFYSDGTPGCYVRTGFPSVEGGSVASDDGNWFGFVASIPFEYWHRG